jgi:hypothetical protein
MFSERCKVTGNICGTDTREVNSPCQCEACAGNLELLNLMRETSERLIRNSKPLEPEFAKIVNDNWMQMIRDSNK